jgi:hypothetical protein
MAPREGSLVGYSFEVRIAALSKRLLFHGGAVDARGASEIAYQ